MSEIANLQPQAIWKNFDLLTQVPRPSGHLAKVQAFLLDWAQQKGVEAFQDNAGNIIMRKPATPGMEDRKYVTLQGHMDMVPQKTLESQHDFENDPIQTYIDGEWVKAKGTTLGADDGMAVATIMAIMEDDTLPHGPIEGFITADEETTMHGVNEMLADTLEGDILLNLDNETEGEMIIGSAGGVNMNASMEFKEVEADSTDAAVKVTLHNLLGGHSGLEINEGRCNANKAMARLVQDAIANFEARFLILIRSSRDSMRECCVETLESAFAMAGMKVETGGDYPAWQPNPQSEIVELMKGIYKEMFGTDNRVQVIHAGLECGVIGAKRPHMDLVSFGPTLRSPHTPNERCHIPSVGKYWDFVKEILVRIPKK